MSPSNPNSLPQPEPKKGPGEGQTVPAPYRSTNPSIPGVVAPIPSAYPPSGAPQPGFATSQPGVGPGAAPNYPPAPQPRYAPPSAPLPGYAPPSMPLPGFTAPPQIYPAPGAPGAPVRQQTAPPAPQGYPQQQIIPQALGVIRDYELGDRADGWADTVEGAGDKAPNLLRIFLSDAPGRLNFPIVRMQASDLGVTGLDALATGIDNPIWPRHYSNIIRRGLNALLRSWLGYVLVIGVPLLLLIIGFSLIGSQPIVGILIVIATLLLAAFVPLLLLAVPFIFTRSAVGERRQYQFAFMLPGASIAIAVKRTGRDLYLSWDLFVRRLWNEAVIGIILLSSAIPSAILGVLLSFTSSAPVPSTNPLQPATASSSSPFGGFLIFLVVLLVGTVVLSINYSILLVIVGLIVKRDPLAFFLKEITLFEYHDISAMTISVDKALRQAADQAGIQAALRPKAQFKVGPRDRLI